MRTLKFIVICFIAVFCCSTLSAQGVKIYKKDKTVIEVPYTELDSIVAYDSEKAGMEFVDMGLSVKWATMNVGATAPEELGDYFAWAETAPKDLYTDDNSTATGKAMSDIGGNPEFDAARAYLGEPARLPTIDEIKELIDNTTTEWAVVNGVDGRMVTSKINGNSIFMPAAGIRNNEKTNFFGVFGAYWTSSPKNGGQNNEAYYIDFNMSYFDWSFYNRYHGSSIRPVCK